MLTLTVLQQEAKAQTLTADLEFEGAQVMLYNDTLTEPFLDPSLSGYEFSPELLFDEVVSEGVTGSNIQLEEKNKSEKDDNKSSRASVRADGGSTVVFPVAGAVISQGLHAGNAIDFAAPVGTSIVAYKGGTVNVALSSGWNGGYGSYVAINHDDGTSSLYAHLDSVSVNKGARIEVGEKVGTIGMTGKTTGPHLHLAVIGGKNPFAGY